MRLSSDSDRRDLLHFEINSSEIMALPSTEKAGRSSDATLVVRDECAYHPFAEGNFAAIGPCIDAGGQSIDLSTVDRQNPDNHFGTRAKEALEGATFRKMESGVELHTEGQTGATLVFLPVKLRPVRIKGMTFEDWWAIQKRKYPATQLEKEYPHTLAEAMKVSAARAFFDTKALDEMSLQIDHPIRDFEDFDTANGLVRVYKRPSIGRRYVVFTDPSNGIEDPFVTVAMDVVTGELVCTATGRVSAHRSAQIHDVVVRAYNDAYNTGEVNSQAGGSFRDTLLSLETPNIAVRRDAEGKVQPGKIGWATTAPLRDKALTDLQEVVRKQLITVHDREAINEFRNFITDDSGKPKASGSGHDDWVLAIAGAWQIAKYAPTGRYEITSSKYRT